MALHNWYFGGAFVLLSANAEHPLVYVMPPSAYAAALSELLQGQFGEPVSHMLRHWTAWLSGPSGVHALAPLGALAIAVLIYVAIARGRFDPWLRLIAVAALAQQAVGLFYIATPRYHLLAWLLTGIVAAVWFRRVAVTWMRRRWPNAWRRAAAHPAVLRLARWLAALQRTYELRDQSAPTPAKA
jgi:hypothetical protein